MCELLWSDPKPAPGRGPSQRGVGVGFGPDVTSNFLQDNGLDLLVRSHEVSVSIAQTLLFCTVTCRTGHGSRPPVACWGYLSGEKLLFLSHKCSCSAHIVNIQCSKQVYSAVPHEAHFAGLTCDGVPLLVSSSNSDVMNCIELVRQHHTGMCLT